MPAQHGSFVLQCSMAGLLVSVYSTYMDDLQRWPMPIVAMAGQLSMAFKDAAMVPFARH